MQLGVDCRHALAGAAHQALDLGSDLGLQMVLQYLALACRQQLAALGDVLGQQPRQGVGTLGAVLVLDGDGEAPVVGFGHRLVAEHAQAALQLHQVLGHLLLHPCPGRVVVGHLQQALFDATGQGEGRIHTPLRGQFKFGQRRGQQAAADEVLQAVHSVQAFGNAFGQERFGLAGARCGDGVGFSGSDQGCMAGINLAFGRVACIARGSQPALKLLDTLAHGLLQGFQAHPCLPGQFLGDGQAFLGPVQQLPRLVFALALRQVFGPGTLPLAHRLHQPDLGVVEMLQRLLQHRQGFGLRRQAQVGGIIAQLLACSLDCRFGVVAADFVAFKPLARTPGVFAGQGRSGDRITQRSFRGRAGPFAFDLGALALQRIALAFELCLRILQLGQRHADLLQSPLSRLCPRTVADVARLRLVPGPGQRTQAIAAVRGQPGFGSRVRLRPVGHAGQQRGHGGRIHRAVLRQGDLQRLAKVGTGYRGALVPAGVQQRLAVAIAQRPVRRHPGIEQAAGLQRRFQAGTCAGIQARMKVHQLPQRRTGALAAHVDATGRWQRRGRVLAGGQARALVLQCSTLLAQDLVTGDQLRVARCVLLQRRLPGARQCRLCGVLALRAWDPFGQALQRRFGVQAQLDQARAVRRPGLDQGLARRFGSLVGLFAPRQGRVQFVARGLHRLLRSG